QRTVADILMLAVMWQRNVEQEVKAMMTLSLNIAEVILNTKINPKDIDVLHDFLSSKLRNFFHININLPDYLLTTLPKFELLEYFYTPNLAHDQEAQLKIFINKEEHIIDLNGLNIQRVFSRAIKNIRAQQD